MPRCPSKDFVDRCRAVEMKQQGMTQRQIANDLRRPERWVRRTLVRYDPQLGLESLRDRSSRPHRSPNRTPPEIEAIICSWKRKQPSWGRRQIARQCRWEWREAPEWQRWAGEGRVRRILARHPEVGPPAAAPDPQPPRQIDYLDCNLLWAADIHQTALPDGSTWETLSWLDLYSRYVLGQLTVPRLSEELVTQSFLHVTAEHGCPLIVKTDRDKLFYDAVSGLPTWPARVLAALHIYHLLIPPRQPWWNGIVERYIRTCQQEIALPAQGTPMDQAMEAYCRFYNQERCHSRCHDQPPATLYRPSQRRIPPDFDLHQVPVTLQPIVLARQVQASGRVSLAGHTLPFSRHYAGQAITVTVDGWSATAQAQDGWQRTWDLHPYPTHPLPDPPPPAPPTPLLRKVSRTGCLHIHQRLYYVGLAWAGLKLTLVHEAGSWRVALPDGSTKTLPDKQFLLPPRPAATSPGKHLPPPQPNPSLLQTRRVTRTGQVAFHRRLYYVGVAHSGQTVNVAPTSDGLVAYTAEGAWITTCPWKEPA